MLTSNFAFVQIRRPATSKHLDRVGVVVDFGDVRDDPIKKCSVVAHNNKCTLEIERELLELFKTNEIKIVRRFIKHQNVKPRQQQGGQPHASSLTARQRGHQRTERCIRKSNFGHHCLHSTFKIGSTKVEPSFKRLAVTIIRSWFAL